MLNRLVKVENRRESLLNQRSLKGHDLIAKWQELDQEKLAEFARSFVFSQDDSAGPRMTETSYFARLYAARRLEDLSKDKD